MSDDESQVLQHVELKVKGTLALPFTAEQLREHWTNISTVPHPAIEDIFVLYHDDQGPTNILVSDDGKHVAAIIDWANVSYVPRFWIATAPKSVGGFCLGIEGVGRWERRVILVDALKREGFEECSDQVREWSDAKQDYDTDEDKLGWSKVV